MTKKVTKERQPIITCPPANQKELNQNLNKIAHLNGARESVAHENQCTFD